MNVYYKLFKNSANNQVLFNKNGIILDFNENFYQLFDISDIKLNSTVITELFFGFQSIDELFEAFELQTNVTFTFNSVHGIMNGSTSLERIDNLYRLTIIVNERFTDGYNYQSTSFTDLIEFFPDPIFIYDMQDYFVYVNQAFTEFHDSAKKLIIGKHITEIYPPAIAKLFISNNKMVRDKGEININESHVVNSKGEEVIALAILRPILNDRKNVVGVIGVARNISTQRHLERTKQEQEKHLRLLEEKLIESQKIENISILAGTFAHDFNNILSSIRGFSELLLLNEMVELKSNYLRKINSAIDQASLITKKLLSIGKKDNQTKVAVNINHIIEDIISLVRFSTIKKITYDLNLQPDLYRIEGFQGQIHQLIMNLIINSIDAIQNEGTITILTSNQVINNDHGSVKMVLFQIKDTGIGINENAREKIFEPFYSTKDGNHSKSGSGLGLSTVSSIVKSLDGKIELESIQNKGTTFRIYLPGYICTKPSDQVQLKKEELDEIHILIIDDNTDLVDILKSYLIEKGFHIYYANNGFKGLEIFKENLSKINLILLDYVMPEMTGLNVYSMLKTLKPEVKIVIMTANSNNTDYMKKLDVVDVVDKPLNLSHLAENLIDILQKN